MNGQYFWCCVAINLHRKQASAGPQSLISDSEIQKAQKTKISNPRYS
jgi:hypothetical protein